MYDSALLSGGRLLLPFLTMGTTLYSILHNICPSFIYIVDEGIVTFEIIIILFPLAQDSSRVFQHLDIVPRNDKKFCWQTCSNLLFVNHHFPHILDDFKSQV